MPETIVGCVIDKIATVPALTRTHILEDEVGKIGNEQVNKRKMT